MRCIETELSLKKETSTHFVQAYCSLFLRTKDSKKLIFTLFIYYYNLIENKKSSIGVLRPKVLRVVTNYGSFLKQVTLSFQKKGRDMNQKAFSVIFVLVNLFFIFFLVFKNSRIVELTFSKQKREKEKIALIKHKEQIEQKLLLAQSRGAIKEYANNYLGMDRIKLKDIKQLPQAHG